jgi:hypothetical protein
VDTIIQVFFANTTILLFALYLISTTTHMKDFTVLAVLLYYYFWSDERLRR